MDYDDDDRTVRACPAAVSLVQEEDDSSTQTCQWRAEPLSAVETNKVMQILQACRDHDLEALSALATSKHGLIEDEIRRTAWPMLLGSDSVQSSEDSEKKQASWRAYAPHRDEEQVKLDVHRSFVYYPSGQSEQQLERRKQQLLDLITEVLRTHRDLCYFQGYHDIVQVLLLVLGPDRAAPAVARLSLLRIRDFMLPSLSAALSHLHLLPALLQCMDPALCKRLSQTQPFFALAATLTLYAHDIQEYGDIARLFDFILAREAVMPVYLFAVIILVRKDELLDISPDEPEMLHFTLSKLPQPLNLEALILQTTNLYARHPPYTLPHRAWKRISSYSVLKTTHKRAELAKQTLEDGERLFARQAAQMRMDEIRQKLIKEVRTRAWMYRRPIFFSITVAVGLLALWLGKETNLASVYGKGMLSGLYNGAIKISVSLQEYLR